MIALAESYGWDWTYHEFRGAAVWDAEMPVGTNDALPRDTNQPRMQTLMSYFSLNEDPLPVRWLSFEGRLNDQHKAVLTWKTEETGVSHYDVERSANARDFRRVGSVAANEAGADRYSLTDPVPVGGTIYYRIRQVDFDGVFSYSPVISVASAHSRAPLAYPNPAKDIVTIESGPEYIGGKAILLNTAGMVLQEITLKEQVSTIRLDGYPGGIYLLHTADGKVTKVVKE